MGKLITYSPIAIKPKIILMPFLHPWWYSQKAQKCHCGEPNCRGEIGATPKGQQTGDVEFLTSPEDDETYEARRSRETLEEYFEKFQNMRGLRNRNETTKWLQKMLLHKDKNRSRTILKALITVRNTKDKSLLKQLVLGHAIKMLKPCLLNFSATPFLVEKVRTAD